MRPQSPLSPQPTHSRRHSTIRAHGGQVIALPPHRVNQQEHAREALAPVARNADQVNPKQTQEGAPSAFLEGEGPAII